MESEKKAGKFWEIETIQEDPKENEIENLKRAMDLLKSENKDLKSKLKKAKKSQGKKTQSKPELKGDVLDYVDSLKENGYSPTKGSQMEKVFSIIRDHGKKGLTNREIEEVAKRLKMTLSYRSIRNATFDLEARNLIYYIGTLRNKGKVWKLQE